jgi:hypothetical protein
VVVRDCPAGISNMSVKFAPTIAISPHKINRKRYSGKLKFQPSNFKMFLPLKSEG